MVGQPAAGQVGADRIRAAFAERAVVLFGAALVAVAFDQEPERRILLQVIGDAVEVFCSDGTSTSESYAK